jgi:sterol desaturase/sphingolipid hydroxylase (fatty acid hydroxylase superfamily)/predicted amino acid dehydrogenase
VATLLRYCVAAAFTLVSHLDALTSRRIVTEELHANRQLERELDWDTPLLLSPLAVIVASLFAPGFTPEAMAVTFQGAGVLAALGAHYLVVEPIYYAFHLWLHRAGPYAASHSHHHSSRLTEAITGTSHPLPETLAYLLVFAPSLLVPAAMGLFSWSLSPCYFVFFDVMNSMGHCNVELVPRWAQLPPLHLLVYTGSYHALHHLRYRCNYCLFCPLYDWLGGTLCAENASLHHRSLQGVQNREPARVVFLGHGGGPLSLLRTPWFSPYWASIGVPHLCWWTLPLWLPAAALIRFIDRCLPLPALVVQRYRVGATSCATWTLPLLATSYFDARRRQEVARRILQAVRQAESSGAAVVGLGALNKAEWINRGGADMLPALLAGCRARVVHGNTLTAGAVWYAFTRCAPPAGVGPLQDATAVVLLGATSKVGRALALLLVRHGYRVLFSTKSDERAHDLMKSGAAGPGELRHIASLSEGLSSSVWILGAAISASTLRKCAPPNAILLDYAVPHFPEAARKGYRYVNGAALRSLKPCSLSYCHDVPGTLPACLAAAVIHERRARPGHELGEVDVDAVEDAWRAAQEEGFVHAQGFESHEVESK